MAGTPRNSPELPGTHPELPSELPLGTPPELFGILSPRPPPLSFWNISSCWRLHYFVGLEHFNSVWKECFLKDTCAAQFKIVCLCVRLVGRTASASAQEAHSASLPSRSERSVRETFEFGSRSCLSQTRSGKWNSTAASSGIMVGFGSL